MDKYNRLVAVAYVEYNSTHLMNVNKWLLVNGYAKTADYPNEFNPSNWNLYVKASP
jgi:micrococcal nuclease